MTIFHRGWGRSQFLQNCSEIGIDHSLVFATPWTAARQASLSITNYRSLLKLMSIESVMPSSHLILCPQSLPASGSFPMSQLFTSGGQRFGVSASASVLPMNTQDWSPLGWTGWISLQRVSRVFSSTTVQKHQYASDCYVFFLRRNVGLFHPCTVVILFLL